MDDKLEQFEKLYREGAQRATSFSAWNQLQLDQDEWSFIAEECGIELGLDTQPTEAMQEIMNRVDIEVFGQICG